MIKKVGVALITAVAIMLLGAFTLNLFFPNVLKQASNAMEVAMFRASGFKLDLNGDGFNDGPDLQNNKIEDENASKAVGVGGVEGFGQ